ncbi:NAD(P)-dependent oxidoreductase [Mangrovicoccus sp. HB161399]|uniref:NAD(P)-dependent oxidoreductase n=1 Tax=Mangrovicoccus sp. HB161399 TaxID=2720392 RepID=UPI001557CAAA|nr:NAD(P)-dependent oxidoreductase [Mangrovicoccus sp. HB161399]
MDGTGSAEFPICFIGFGEAAGAFLGGWALPDPAAVSAFDIKSDDPATRPAMAERQAAAGIRGCDTAAAALAGARAVFSLVTADRALEAAVAAAPHLEPGALWLDGNSCAPGTKRRAAETVETAGGRYVDLAVMAPVHPLRHLVPLLLSGPHAAAAAALLRTLGMRPAIAGDEIGQASAIKMIRSVMIKGMEALTAECLLSARRAGVEEAVLGSLEASDPDRDWRGRSAYNLERMMVHGARRAAEMREAAATVAELGLGGGMAAATAEWQDRIAATGAPAGGDDLIARADAILARL